MADCPKCKRPGVRGQERRTGCPDFYDCKACRIFWTVWPQGQIRVEVDRRSQVVNKEEALRVARNAKNEYRTRLVEAIKVLLDIVEEKKVHE